MKVAVLGIKARGRKPHVAVFTGTLREPLQASAVYIEKKKQNTVSPCLLSKSTPPQSLALTWNPNQGFLSRSWKDGSVFKI